MKQVLLFFLLQLFFNVNINAQIENRSVEGNWRSVKMKLVKDEFRPFYMYYPESEEDVLRLKINKGFVCFDREVIGCVPNTLYALAFKDQQSMMNPAKIVIVKSDDYHIVISVSDSKHIGLNPPTYYIAFERDY
mgnify:CR=1 FL=1